MLVDALKIICVVLLWIAAFYLGFSMRKALFWMLKLRRQNRVKKEKTLNQDTVLKGRFKRNNEDTSNYSIIEDDKLDDNTKANIDNLKNGEIKQCFFVNSELEMGAGKIAAQVGHASIAVYSHVFWEGLDKEKESIQAWEETNRNIEVFKVPNSEKLKSIQKFLKSKGIFARIICDAGRTQIKAGSITVLGTLPLSKDLKEQLLNDKDISQYHNEVSSNQKKLIQKKEKKEPKKIKSETQPPAAIETLNQEETI